MSKFYHVNVEADHKWIGAPNNGGECCIFPEDTVEELNRLLAERDAANARIKRLEAAWDHVALRLSSWRLQGGQWLCQGDKDAFDAWNKAKEAKP